MSPSCLLNGMAVKESAHTHTDTHRMLGNAAVLDKEVSTCDSGLGL